MNGLSHKKNKSTTLHSCDFIPCQTLKKDALGAIELGLWEGNKRAIKRVYSKHFLLRPLSKWLAHKEIAALKRLEGLSLKEQIPLVLANQPDYHIRSYIEGVPLHRLQNPPPSDFFQDSKKLLLHMRKAGVCHNDLAKEANWLITPAGLPALTDFQLAWISHNRRSRLFLFCCYDDLRHLLKHKNKYSRLVPKERAILARRSLLSRVWKNTGKKVYLFITRKILGWQERTGPEERDI